MKRRFIASAICPVCEKLDKIVMFDDENNQRWRECVSCGYKDLLIEPPIATVATEITTRVNQPPIGEKPLAHETAIEVVTIMDPKKLH